MEPRTYLTRADAQRYLTVPVTTSVHHITRDSPGRILSAAVPESPLERRLQAMEEDDREEYGGWWALLEPPRPASRIPRFKCHLCGCEKTRSRPDIGIEECAWCAGEGRDLRREREPESRSYRSRWSFRR